MAVGSTREDRLALARPIDDRVFWAGEATEPDYFGTVHGAVLSGWRAAAEMVKRYG
jgi:monoamine oxidase